MSDDFTAFMTARYDEAEALARKAGGGAWRTDCDCGGDCAGYPGCERVVGDDITLYNEGGHDSWQAEHIAACDPEHRLADIALKRAILAMYTETLNIKNECERKLASGGELAQPRDYLDAGRELAALEPVVRQLGTEFSGHPEYREAWKP